MSCLFIWKWEQSEQNSIRRTWIALSVEITRSSNHHDIAKVMDETNISIDLRDIADCFSNTFKNPIVHVTTQRREDVLIFYFIQVPFLTMLTLLRIPQVKAD